jgi:predicted small secreted protein
MAMSFVVAGAPSAPEPNKDSNVCCPVPDAAKGVARMRMVIVRTLLGILLVAAAGASLSACSNTWQGIKADWHSNTGW